MKAFNVITYDFNTNELYQYNIIPYLVKCYDEAKIKPKTFEEFKEFVEKESKYQWWSRCEYEIVITGFPCNKVSHKIDIYYQIMMNLDIITKLLISEIIWK